MSNNTITNPNPSTGATVHSAPKQKRGKKGTKIALAFASLTDTPVTVSQVSGQFGVSVAVLRQAKRFDRAGQGEVHVKKDKTSGELMIWRAGV